MSAKRKGQTGAAHAAKGIVTAFAVFAAALCILSALIQKGRLSEGSMMLTGCCALFLGSMAGCLVSSGGRKRGSCLLPAGALAGVILLGSLVCRMQSVSRAFPFGAVFCSLLPGLIVSMSGRKKHRT